jgi:DNA-binding CsgD family transcriptional regulator
MTYRMDSLNRKRRSRLKATEYRTLKCFFKLMTVDEEAWRYKISNKTIYGMRSRVAAKLGVKKLNEILMW